MEDEDKHSSGLEMPIFSLYAADPNSLFYLFF